MLLVLSQQEKVVEVEAIAGIVCTQACPANKR
jgi:hypothetical protein